jgi:hypothetical protein
MKKLYLNAGRKEHGEPLVEMEAVTDLHRESLVRLMNDNLERTPQRRQRDRSYDPKSMTRRALSPRVWTASAVSA